MGFRAHSANYVLDHIQFVVDKYKIKNIFFEDDNLTFDEYLAYRARIAELAAKYLPLAKEMLAEAIRIPADYVDKPAEKGGDPLCGTSNHEFPRLEYLRKKIIEIKAIAREPGERAKIAVYSSDERIDPVASERCPVRSRSIVAMGASRAGVVLSLVMPGSEMRKLLTQLISG